MTSEALSEEIEAVEAILMASLDVTSDQNKTVVRSKAACIRHFWKITFEFQVRIKIDPKTASDDEKKFVSVTLEIEIPKEYPDASPIVNFRNPRGLSDDLLDRLQELLASKCQDLLGCLVLFELIDTCSDFLTEYNVPSCQCAICLYQVTSEDHIQVLSSYTLIPDSGWRRLSQDRVLSLLPFFLPRKVFTKRHEKVRSSSTISLGLLFNLFELSL